MRRRHAGQGRRLWRPVRRVATLPTADWCLLAEAWVRLLWTTLRLRVPPVPELPAARASTSAGHEGDDARTRETIVRLARIVRIAADRHLLPVRCLARALVLHGLLRRRGVPAVLRIGVRKEGEELAAHAWLECRGRRAVEPEDLGEAFRPLERGSCSS